MKKFLCIFVLAVVLITAFALPSFADDAYVLEGTWVFNDVLSLPSTSGNMLSFEGVQAEFVGLASNKFAVERYIGAGGDYYRFVYWVNSSKTAAYSFNTNVWDLPDAQTITFTAPYTATQAQYEWFTANARQLGEPCDGSTCPANDVNHDNICDDCASPLALRSFGNVYEVVVKHSEDLTLLYRYTEVETGTVFNAIYDDNRIIVTFDNQVRHQQFELVDGEWIEYTNVSIQWDSHAISHSADASIVRSDLDVFYPNGDYFFQIPLWEKVEGVTQGEMNQLNPKVVGTMTILTLCGVGLMALLVVLSLFGKRSLLFLKK